MSRPTGVTIIAILVALVGVIALLAGAGLAAASSYIGVALGRSFAAGFIGIFGGVMIVLGLLYLFLAYGFWNGKGWAWIVGVILMIIGIVLGIAMLFISYSSIVSILIDLLILYYLTRPNVKAFFGRGQATL
jgi:uncharacterized membrane protein (DUF2068 family)